VRWNAARLNAGADGAYTVATDVADALIARGITARRAHALVGGAVAAAEVSERPLDANDLRSLANACGLDDFRAPLRAREAVEAKRTAGSTNPDALRASIDEAERELDALAGQPA
jgi:argininosuccinate lyase